MIANLKIAHVAHLGIVKLAAAKAFVGAGVLVGGAATGLVATEVLAPDYMDAANALINQAVDVEAGRTSPMLRPIELPRGVSRTEGNPAASVTPHEILITHSPSAILASDDSKSADGTPQVQITAKRMSGKQKLAYDIDHRLLVLASQE